MERFQSAIFSVFRVLRHATARIRVRDAKRRAQRYHRNERGVSLIQFALIFPLLMLIIMGFLDLARYFATLAVLNAGAERGLNQALKIANLDVDYRFKSPTDPEYLRFREARERIVAAAIVMPRATIVGDTTSADQIRLRPITITDAGFTLAPGDIDPAPYTAGAMVLRPGECAAVDGFGTRCNRSTLHLGPTDPAPPTSPGELMKTHPVQVVLRAEMKSYLPFFDKYAVFGQAIGYREVDVPRGPFASAAPTETPTPDPAATPTPGPTPTPGWPPMPGITPVPVFCTDDDFLEATRTARFAGAPYQLSPSCFAQQIVP